MPWKNCWTAGCMQSSWDCVSVCCMRLFAYNIFHFCPTSGSFRAGRTNWSRSWHIKRSTYKTWVERHLFRSDTFLSDCGRSNEMPCNSVVCILTICPVVLEQHLVFLQLAKPRGQPCERVFGNCVESSSQRKGIFCVFYPGTWRH